MASRSPAGMASGGVQAPGITGGNTAGEEHPGVRAFPGARDFRRGRYAELDAGLHKRLRVVAPFRLVESTARKW
jgi:hypothetical protein